MARRRSTASRKATAPANSFEAEPLPWHASPHPSTPRTCRPSARRWTRGKGRRTLLAAAFQGLRAVAPVDEGQHARRDFPCLQRPRHRLQPGGDPDLRHRHRGGIPCRRRGLGSRRCPASRGIRTGLAHRAVGDQDDFDLTIVNKMDVDHGLTIAALADVRPVDAWPCPVIPFAVNVVQYPVPSGNRCYQLGRDPSARPSNPSTATSTCRYGAPAA